MCGIDSNGEREIERVERSETQKLNRIHILYDKISLILFLYIDVKLSLLGESYAESGVQQHTKCDKPKKVNYLTAKCVFPRYTLFQSN